MLSTDLNPAISRDAADPDFARSLRSIGPVTPSPTLSNSSTFNSYASTSQQSTTGPSPTHPQMFPSPATNPAIQVVDARNRLTDEAEAEFADMGRRGFEGRRFLDVVLIRQMLSLRDEKGMEAGEIERRLGLRKGVVERLGAKGVVGDVGAQGGDFGG